MVPHIDAGALFRSVRRILAAALLALAVLIGIGGVVVAQAGRDETGGADTAVLMLDGSAGAQAARIDRAVRLYLGEQISRVILVGPDPVAARDQLIARGVVKDKISEVHGSSQIEQLEQVQQSLASNHIADAMLIGEPVEALRLLKIARDHGLLLRSAPAGADTQINFGDVIEEVGRYLVYCFMGR
jgi:hypothetical protein